MSYIKRHRGFTLIEVLVGTAVFLVVASAAYGAFVSLIKIANVSQSRILAVELADEQFEIIRNMPYVNVGLTNGIPQGVLPQTQTLMRGGFTFTVTLAVRNQNLSTSTVQASSKLVEVDVNCPSCQSFSPLALTGQVSPANLQSAASGGALIIQVDSGGVPLQGATIVVQSTATSSVTDTDITDNNGYLDVIGVPSGYQVYHITATKAGYSTSQTSPDITVNQGQPASVNLSIDKLSTLSIASVGLTCQAVPNFHFRLTGAKQYSQNLATDGTGNITLTSMVPDMYTLVPTDSSNDADGITPFSPFKLQSDSVQSEQVVVVPANENSLMVSVQDNGTKLPLSGATVELSNVSGYDQILITGQGYFDQTDWSDGSGSASFTFASSKKYWQTDAGNNIDTATSSGSIVMRANPSTGRFSTSATGTLESSTFDTGTTSNFYSLNWAPTGQPILAGSAPVKFQFATAASSSPNGPWNYLGPDGTANTYYAVPGMQINSVNNNAEFARYLLYMTTATSTVTPSVGDVSFTFTSGCTPPGQVIFQGLSAGSYTLKVSKSSYTTQTASSTIVSGWQSRAVSL